MENRQELYFKRNPADLDINGVSTTSYFDFEYHPLLDTEGKTYCILHTAVDVSERMKAWDGANEKDKLAQQLIHDLGSANAELNTLNEKLNDTNREVFEMNTRLNIAIDAGSFGSTEVDVATGSMICNEQFRKCFGKTMDEEFTYPMMFQAMLPKYRDEIRRRVRAAQEGHNIYQAEYEIEWPDGSIHWISAHGSARYDANDMPVKWIGIISVTESKRDEQRKDDFIGMVSMI